MARKCTHCWVDPTVRRPDPKRGSGLCPKCHGRPKPLKVCDLCEKGRRGLSGRCVVCRGTGEV